MRTQTTRTIVGRVNADGTPASGGPFTSRKTGTGVYGIAFPGARLVGLTCASAQIWGFLVADTFTTDGCRVQTSNPSQVPTDTPWGFTAAVTA